MGGRNIKMFVPISSLPSLGLSSYRREGGGKFNQNLKLTDTPYLFTHLYNLNF